MKYDLNLKFKINKSYYMINQFYLFNILSLLFIDLIKMYFADV